MNLSRNTYVDFLKGILTFPVLWGHCIQHSSATGYDYFNDIAFRIIYSFHMPLFMMLSGYVFYITLSKKGRKKVIKSCITKYLIPIALWSAIYWIISKVLPAIIKGKLDFDTIQDYYTIAGGMFLWFIWSLIVCMFVVILLELKKDSFAYRAMTILGCIAVMMVFPNKELNLYMLPYFLVGYYFNKYEYKCSSLKKYVGITIPFYIIMLIFFKKEYYIYILGITFSDGNLGEQLFIDAYRYVIGFLGCISVLIIMQKVYQILKNSKFANRIELIGSQYSLQIYILQCIGISWLWNRVYSKIVDILGNNYLTANIFLYDLVITPLMAMAGLFVFCLITDLLKKNKTIYGILFGR